MIKYIISPYDISKQLLKIELEWTHIDENLAPTVEIAAWRPGRYELQNYAALIFDLNCKGKNLKFINKNEYQIEDKVVGQKKISYLFHASKLDAGGSWFDQNGLYLNPINCLMYPKGINDDQIEVQIKNIEGKYKGGLLSNNNGTIIAKSKYELYDSPFFISNQLQIIDYQVKNIDFSIVIWSNIQFSDHFKQSIQQQFIAFTQSQIEVFGSFPETNYQYLLKIPTYQHYHGVEHRNSTTLVLGPDIEQETDLFREKLLGIASHELFHTWNICKIRPIELENYDYSKEIYFDTCWVAEGITTYYGDLMLVRSGVWSIEKYLNELATTITRHQSNAGKDYASLSFSSLNLWVDGYQTSVQGRKVSVYDTGSLAALILDLSIRQDTNDQKSLDDLMKTLYLENRIYSNKSIQSQLEKLTEKSYQWFFNGFIFFNADFVSKIKELIFGMECSLMIEIKDNKTAINLLAVNNDNKRLNSWIFGNQLF